MPECVLPVPPAQTNNIIAKRVFINFWLSHQLSPFPRGCDSSRIQSTSRRTSYYLTSLSIYIYRVGINSGKRLGSKTDNIAYMDGEGVCDADKNVFISRVVYMSYLVTRWWLCNAKTELRKCVWHSYSGSKSSLKLFSPFSAFAPLARSERRFVNGIRRRNWVIASWNLTFCWAHDRHRKSLQIR